MSIPAIYRKIVCKKYVVVKQTKGNDRQNHQVQVKKFSSKDISEEEPPGVDIGYSGDAQDEHLVVLRCCLRMLLVIQ